MSRVVVILFMCVLAASMPLRAQDLGCGSAVGLDGADVTVGAVSGDDTENIQCALTAAARDGYRNVFLSDAEYDVGGIEVTGFVGDLAGRSTSKTKITVTDGALACGASTPGAVLRFNVGNVAVRKIAFDISSACAEPGSVNVIAFYSDPSDCSKRTGNGNVDRIAISGAGTSSDDYVTGVVMDAAPECDPVNEKILGTLKVNRSTLSGIDFGVITSLGGGAQVDINYNEIASVGLPISIIDAGQSTTILGNDITYNDVASYDVGTGLGTTAILIGSTENAPADNGTTIKNNKFNDAGSTSEGYAVLSAQFDKSVNHGMVMTGNTFTGDSDNSGGAGIAVLDTANGLVSGNTFNSYAPTWLYLSSGDSADGAAAVTVDGWAIVGNIFSASTADTDIGLGDGTRGNVVGRSQNQPVVTDLSGDNDVLESSASASFFIGGDVRVGAQRQHEKQINFLSGRRGSRQLAN